MSFLIAKEAPNFIEKAIMGNNDIKLNFNLKEYLNGSKGILFFYPLNFSFVCPSEIIAFDKKLTDFKKRNTKIVGISIDSHFSHLQYKRINIKDGGIGNIKFPLVSDLSKNISRNYDVLLNQEISLRGTFLIDEDFLIRHQSVNDLPLGRNINEIIRIIDALDFYNNNNNVCPANWNKGDPAIIPSNKGIKNYLNSLYKNK